MTHEQVKQEIAKLLEGNNDPEKIKQAAVIDAHLDELKADEDKLITSNSELGGELKKAILNGSYKPQNTPEEKGTQAPAQPQSLADFAKDYLAKQSQNKGETK